MKYRRESVEVNLMKDTAEQGSTGGEARTHYSELSKQLDRGESVSSCSHAEERTL